MAMCVHVHVEIGVHAEWWYNTYRGDGRGHVCVCSCISILGGGVCVWCMWGCRGVCLTLVCVSQGTLFLNDHSSQMKAEDPSTEELVIHICCGVQSSV